ncbi:Transmembrane protein 97 [Rhizoclosmatium sp. JEL0117]|nr:Transmembrane protein 97 [Rhizoclosmatium sp. JEL0117]
MAQTVRRPLSSRPGDIAMLIFFILHIPISLFIDAQIIWPSLPYPELALNANADYIRDTNDFLLIERKPWFLSLVWCEFIIQLPFYLYLIWALVRDSKYVRTAGIIYGTHTCTCLVPILYEMIFTDNGIQTFGQKAVTVAIYSIWFVMPFAILVACIFRQSPPLKKGKTE